MTEKERIYCPHCGTKQMLEFTYSNVFGHEGFTIDDQGYQLEYSVCLNCDKPIIYLNGGTVSAELSMGRFFIIPSSYRDEQKMMIFPTRSKFYTIENVPEDYKRDFVEAIEVIVTSKKASAALSRRILQRLLQNHFNIKKSNLAEEIAAFIGNMGAPSYLADAVDAVRIIGNFAAHPIKSTSTGEIVDVEESEAEWLLEVLEALFEYAFIQPERLQKRRNELNAKLVQSGKRPMQGRS